MRRFNLYDDAALAPDDDDPPVYHAPFAKVSDVLGAEKLGATVLVLDPGKAVCPYHYEVIEEEWLIVLSGTPSIRTPAGEEVLEAGDVVCFPRGEAGAHRIFNDGPEPSRILIVSERATLGAAVYPDSDKIGIFGLGLRELYRRGDARDYYDGEPATGAG